MCAFILIWFALCSSEINFGVDCSNHASSWSILSNPPCVFSVLCSPCTHKYGGKYSINYTEPFVSPQSNQLCMLYLSRISLVSYTASLGGDFIINSNYNFICFKNPFLPKLKYIVEIMQLCVNRLQCNACK